MKDSKHQSNPFLNVVGNVLKAISFVIGTFFLATILELCGMHTWSKSASENRLYERTQLEIQQIESFFGNRFHIHWFHDIHSYATMLSSRMLLPLEKYLESQQRKLEDAPTSMSAVVNAIVEIQQSINRHFSVAIEVFRAWLFRWLIFILGIASVSPLILVGLIDGLVRREIRRWSGGSESAWLFILASKSVVPSIVLFLLIYVLWPWKLTFHWINLLMGVWLGTMLSLATSRFKKYL